MDTSDDKLLQVLEWAFGLLLAAIAAIIGWIWNDHSNKLNRVDLKVDTVEDGMIRRINTVEEVLHGKVDTVEKEIVDLKLDGSKTMLELANHRIYLEQYFPNKVDVKSAIERVHEQIEKGNALTEKLRDDMHGGMERLSRDFNTGIQEIMRRQGD